MALLVNLEIRCGVCVCVCVRMGVHIVLGVEPWPEHARHVLYR